MGDEKPELSKQELLDQKANEAENSLYDYLDRNGSDKRAAYVIGELIDAKIEAELNRCGLALPPQKESRE